LVVVGTGIQWGGQATIAAEKAIRGADRVLFAVGDPWAARWIRSLRPDAESLLYPRDGRPRKAIYGAMVERILEELRRGHRVCAAFYGSPSLLNAPAHEAVRRARAEGRRARMLPGVSSLECLCADLGIDPGEGGSQVFEAGDYLLRRRVADPHGHLVLCQIAVIGWSGVFDPNDRPRIRRGLALLGERLQAAYPPEHDVVLYEASSHPLTAPRIERIPLSALADAELREISTLYVPPLGPAPIDEDLLRRLQAPSQSTKPPAAAEPATSGAHSRFPAPPSPAPLCAPNDTRL
jgi:hypothetical protein